MASVVVCSDLTEQLCKISVGRLWCSRKTHRFCDWGVSDLFRLLMSAYRKRTRSHIIGREIALPGWGEGKPI